MFISLSTEIFVDEMLPIEAEGEMRELILYSESLSEPKAETYA